jgi:hypothetical protein
MLPCCGPSTRIHKPAHASMPSDFTKAEKRMRCSLPCFLCLYYLLSGICIHILVFKELVHRIMIQFLPAES